MSQNINTVDRDSQALLGHMGQPNARKWTPVVDPAHIQRWLDNNSPSWDQEQQGEAEQDRFATLCRRAAGH